MHTLDKGFFNFKIEKPCLTWAIFLEDVADYFYDCNYLCFQNGGFGNKWLYAFISDILYINENCTAITFEIDVMQTWLFDFEIKKSFRFTRKITFLRTL